MAFGYAEAGEATPLTELVEPVEAIEESKSESDKNLSEYEVGD